MDFQNRQYDPQLGRFLSIDPMAEATVSLSPYTGMNNNPVSITDPLGLIGEVNPAYNSTTPVFAPYRALGWWHYTNQGVDKTLAGGMTEDDMKKLSDAQKVWQMLQSLGHTGVAAQGSSGSPNNSGIMLGTVGEVTITGSKGKSGPGFFGKIWGGVKSAWNGFGKTVGGAMEGIHAWMNRKLGHEADSKDRGEDKGQGGIMFTGEGGTYGAGRIGIGDKKAETVDDMGHITGLGGSDFDLPGSFVAELIERSNDIYGRFTGGNGILDFMKSEPRQTYLPGPGISPCPNGDCIILDTTGHDNRGFPSNFQKMKDSLWGPGY
jgi:hypothetical protein